MLFRSVAFYDTFDISFLDLAVGAEHELAEEVDGKSHACAVGFHEVILGIADKERVAVGLESLRDNVGNSLAVFFFVVNLILAEHFLVVFLAEFCRLVDNKFGDVHLEVAACRFNLVAVDMEHRSDFCLIAVAGIKGIEHNLVANLGSFELLGFCFRLESEGSDDAVVDLNSAFADPLPLPLLLAVVASLLSN